MTGFMIRRAQPEDAAGIAAMFNGLDYEDLGEEANCPFTAEIVMRDAIGPDAILQTEVAIADGEVVGAAAHNLSYHAETAQPARWMEMLYVTSEWRAHGVGYALMRAVAAFALKSGCDCVAWGVRKNNARGIAFYDQVGAGNEAADIRVLQLDGLQQLVARQT